MLFIKTKLNFHEYSRFIVLNLVMHLPPGIHFSVNNGKFRLSYFCEFAMDFPETSQVKFGLIWYDKSIHGDEFLF